jgi:hypothetical protein
VENGKYAARVDADNDPADVEDDGDGRAEHRFK